MLSEKKELIERIADKIIKQDYTDIVSSLENARTAIQLRDIYRKFEPEEIIKYAFISINKETVNEVRDILLIAIYERIKNNNLPIPQNSSTSNIIRMWDDYTELQG